MHPNQPIDLHDGPASLPGDRGSPSGDILLVARPTDAPPQIGDVVAAPSNVITRHEHFGDAFRLEVDGRRLTNRERLRTGREQPRESLYALRVTELRRHWTEGQGGTTEYRVDGIVRAEVVGPVSLPAQPWPRR